MSKATLEAIIARARTDPLFLNDLVRDLDGTIKEAGFTLDAYETGVLRQMNAQHAAAQEDLKFQQEIMRGQMISKAKQQDELRTTTVDILRDTLKQAKRAYAVITNMNIIMFLMGSGLLVFSAVMATILREEWAAALSGGLGLTTFAAIFFFGPIERTQIAISNLVQVEIGFMNYFEQIYLWETYALMPDGMTLLPDPKRIVEASARLQERSEETIRLLQEHVEKLTKIESQPEEKT